MATEAAEGAPVEAPAAEEKRKIDLLMQLVMLLHVSWCDHQIKLEHLLTLPQSCRLLLVLNTVALDLTMAK